MSHLNGADVGEPEVQTTRHELHALQRVYVEARAQQIFFPQTSAMNTE